MVAADLPIRVGRVRQDAEGVVGEGVAEENAAVGGDLVLSLRVRARQRARESHARMIEGLGELDVDRRADRAAGERRIRGLEDVDFVHEVRADGAEVETPGGVAQCGRDLAAIVERFVEARSEAAHGNLRCVAYRGRNAAHRARTAADRDSGHAHHGGREVGIRELADVFGGDRIDDAVGIALDVQALLQRGAQSGDDDFFELVRLRCRTSSLATRRRLRLRQKWRRHDAQRKCRHPTQDCAHDGTDVVVRDCILH